MLAGFSNVLFFCSFFAHNLKILNLNFVQQMFNKFIQASQLRIINNTEKQTLCLDIVISSMLYDDDLLLEGAAVVTFVILLCVWIFHD